MKAASRELEENGAEVCDVNVGFIRAFYNSIPQRVEAFENGGIVTLENAIAKVRIDAEGIRSDRDERSQPRSIRFFQCTIGRHVQRSVSGMSSGDSGTVAARVESSAGLAAQGPS